LGEAPQYNFAAKGAIVNLAAGLMRYAHMDGDSGTLAEFKTFAHLQTKRLTRG
jgi:hypothetical protein